MRIAKPVELQAIDVDHVFLVILFGHLMTITEEGVMHVRIIMQHIVSLVSHTDVNPVLTQ